MQPIKSFTDIEQSKKLAEILPLESADMNYWCGTQIRIGGHRTMDKDLDVPCWSLAALLGVLIYPHIEQNYKGKWTCRVEHGNTTYLWEDSNSIDACVAMIEKLHEQNIL